MLSESLVEVLNRLSGASDNDNIDQLLRLLALQPGTVVLAFIERAQRALRDDRPEDALLYFLNAYQHQTEDDARLFHWMARAARAQGADQQANRLEQLASDVHARQTQERSGQLVTPKSIGSGPRISKREAGMTLEPRQQPVEIIIPVYRGETETLACLEAVIAARPKNKTPHHLRVLNDASPEPDLVKALEQLALQTEGMTLVHHPANLGFIRGVNRAMAACPERDVLWLNADTRVTDDWLDRLRAWAYHQPKVATVTPFSNHGELLTFPEPRYRYPMPDPIEQGHLDRAAQAANRGRAPLALPFGCGFCLYLRRDAIRDLGDLDEARLAGGYGEDTEWCLRATAQGWTHLAAPDVFVAHQGSVSFGADKIHRVASNNAVIRALYPGAERAYEQFVTRDSLAVARQAIQRARFDDLADWLRQAIGPEPPLGSVHLHPRHLHLLGPLGIADPACPYFAERPASVFAARQGPPGLLWLASDHRSQDPVIWLRASLGTLPIELRYAVPGEIGRLRSDLKALPLIGIVDHYPGRQPAFLVELLEQIEQPIVGLDRIHAVLEPVLPHFTDPESYPDQVWIIADSLQNLRLQQLWTRIARAFARQSAAPRLLILEGHARPIDLFATGQALDLPELPGLCLAELAALAGCSAVVTIETTRTAQAVALALANRLQLPAYSLDPAAVVDALSQPEDGDFTVPSKTFQPATKETPPAMTSPTVRSETGSTSDHERPAFLNIGCGRADASRLPGLFRNGHWREIRLDIDPSVQADIIGSSVDLSKLEDDSLAAAYSSHTLEHLEPHEVPLALREIYRVLKPEGFALITLPDLESVAQLVVEGKLTDTAYQSPVGPITALDMLFGHRKSLADGNNYMAHRTGFTVQHLGESLLAAGFAEVRIRKGRCYDLWAYAFKQKLEEDPPWLAFPASQLPNAT